MRFILVLAGLLLALQPGSAQNCDRECRNRMLSRYLNAVAAHDTRTLPLAANARFTEHTVEKPLGEGLWKKASGLGTFRQDILDVRQSVAGTHVVMQENGTPVLFQERLKIVTNRISEIDTTAPKN